MSRLFSGSYDHTIREWDTDTGECIRVLEGHTRWVYALALDGRRLFSGSFHTIREWDTDTGECTRVLTGHTGSVLALALDKSGYEVPTLQALCATTMRRERMGWSTLPWAVRYMVGLGPA